ncbi:CoxG family protein [Limnohabitans sp.]|jgi:carbon monoxide dehydrogenase subunit G|uniref:CoxG family protein n=1 Tax=Limnohabitans sp. TaxID=1907725 RepID=UPI002FDE7FA4
MDMQGQRVLKVTQAQAWSALNDPEVLKSCIAGCDKFELIDNHVYSVGVAIKIGPVSAKFSGKVSLSDIQPPNSYALHFDAQGGVAGFGKGESQVSLLPHPEGCELRYTVHSSVGGKLAQLGQRLIDGAAKSLAEDFFKKFEEALLAQSLGAGNSAAPSPDPEDQGKPSMAVWVWPVLLLAAGLAWWAWA